MKITIYILMILFFSSSCSAQHYAVIEALHTTNLGGVKGSRSENFTIKVKNNSKIEPQYLLTGNVKISLKKELKNGILYLQGSYLPEPPDQITIDMNGTIKNSAADQLFDLSNVYLVSENIKNKKQVKQKINFPNNHENNNKIRPNSENVPE